MVGTNDNIENSNDNPILVDINLAHDSNTAKNLEKVIRNGIRMASNEEPLKNELKKNNVLLQSELEEVGDKITGTANAITEALKPISKIQDILIKDLKIQQEQLTALKEERKKEKSNALIEEVKTNKKFQKALMVAYQYAKVALKITSGTFEDFHKIIEKSMGRFRDLNEAGIRLTNGYENTIWKLSNEAGMAIDDFVKVLGENSKYVNALTLGNKQGGEDTISAALGKITGYMGTTEKQARSILNYFNESIYGVVDMSSMTEEQYLEQITKTTKHLQELSKATGLSVEQIIQKNKLDEQELLHRQLKQHDEGGWSTLRSAGLSAKEIEYIMLGTPSAEVIGKMAVNNTEAQAFETARKAYAEGGVKGMKEAFIKYNADIPKLSKDTLATLSYTDNNSILRKIADFSLATYMDSYGAKGGITPKESEDINSLTSAINYQKSLNNLYNEALASTTPKITQVGVALDKMKVAIDAATSTVRNTTGSDGAGRSLFSWGSAAVSSIFGTVVGSYATKKAFDKIRGVDKLKNIKNSTPPKTPPPKTKIPKAVKGLGVLGSVASILQSVSVLSDFADKGVSGSIDDYKKNWSGWDWVNPSKWSAVAFGYVGDVIGKGLTDSQAEMANRARSMKNDALKMGFEEWTKKHGHGKVAYDGFRGVIPGGTEQNTSNSLKTSTNELEYLKNNVVGKKEIEQNILNISDYVKNIASSLLSNDIFKEKINELIDLNNQMIGHLRNIADNNITMTDRVVASQGR